MTTNSGLHPAGAGVPTVPLPPPDTLETKNVVKNRELLYRLMVSQLFYDGNQKQALEVQSVTNPDPPCPPSDRLFNLMMMGLEYETQRKRKKEGLTASISPDSFLGPGLDLEFETEMHTNAPEPAMYETAYVTSHKGPCRAGAFSPDAQMVATGSQDASIKILDVSRMLAKSAPEAGMESSGPESQGHPVIRTLYDHVEEVTCLEFHPREPILASGSRDYTVKLFDYSKTSVKKAFRTITDADQVKCLSFHPGGDFIVVGTNHSVIRLYDVQTAQAFVCNIPSHQHTSGITTIKYSPDAKVFASGSRDGSIKIWDGVSNRCVNTFIKAHGGAEVCSVTFTRNGKYLLSSGKDSLVKLWELNTSRCLIAYTGAGTTGKQEHKTQAVFNHTEDFVMFPDEATTSLCAWNSRNASRKHLLSLGHNGPVRHISHSPTTAAFLTCSDDFRARFWSRRVPTH
ncbi:Cleavage stimulation factor subunit 1 [Frankliniella fusca]|uniref:Cleavage stimulation factor subunit 1 n=1 Tax=Frankliniella fusca TaxID=407009 RepID=A0AAE1LJ05_9NEOP|nr:Cleavage stimulation factor subunit 1 [Frankliniella fusca]